MAQQKTQPTSTPAQSQADPEGVVGGGQADGSPTATSHQGQPGKGPQPGHSNTPGGALKTGPKSGKEGMGTTM